MRAWAAPPTCMSRGLRAYQGVYVHTQGFTCERAMWLSGRYHPGQAPDNVRPDMLATTLARRPTMCSSNPYPRELPKTQTTSAKMGESGVLCSRWSAFWAPHHLEQRPRHHQTGGIALHEGPTRRRHAAEGRHVVQNPHHSQPEVRRIASKTGARPLGAKNFAQHRPSTGISAKKFAQQAQKRRIWANLSAQGEFFRAFTI